MIRLVLSEFLRIRSRRLIWVLAILMVLGVVVGSAIAAANSHPPTSADVERAHASYLSEHASCVAGDFHMPSAMLGGKTLRQWCDENIREADFAPTHEFVLSTLSDILKGTSFLLIVMGLVIGSSSVGADWHSGSMSTLLTWEPRRLRVLAVRIVVVAATVFFLAIALQALLSLALAAVAATRGDTTGLGGTWLQDLTLVIARIGAMAVFGAVVGLSVSMIGRATAASLGVVFVYLAVVESLLWGLKPGIAPWLLSTNSVVFVSDDPLIGGPGTDPFSVTHAVVVMTIYAVALVVVAAALFRSRDVD